MPYMYVVLLLLLSPLPFLLHQLAKAAEAQAVKDAKRMDAFINRKINGRFGEQQQQHQQQQEEQEQDSGRARGGQRGWGG